LKGNGVAVLAISIDGAGARAAKPVIDEGKFTFSAPVDEKMGVARNFGVRGVPTTFVVDRKGNVVAQGFGPIDFDGAAFRNYVKALAARAG
jgi:peroxiredoxin